MTMYKIFVYLLALPIFTCAFLPLSAHALPVRSAILVNMQTGKILYAKNASAAIPPASLTKVMNMFITLDDIDRGKITLRKRVTISKNIANTSGSSMHLRPQDNISLHALLTGMAVASGNDAARATALCVSGSERRHIQRMNAKARSLGMRNTTFKTVSGLPAQGQLTTAKDMLTMARAYLKQHPSALVFHNTRIFLYGGRQMRNTNNLLGTVDGVDGLKTGYTNASGYNLIFTGQRNGIRLMGVVLGGNSVATRDQAARVLLEAGFRTPQNRQKVTASVLAAFPHTPQKTHVRKTTKHTAQKKHIRKPAKQTNKKVKNVKSKKSR